MTDPATSAAASTPTVTLRVGEARVEDIGHAIARMAPADLMRLALRPGDAGGGPAFGKAVIFQAIRTIPAGAVVIGPRTDIRVVEGEQTGARAPAVSYEDIGGLEREVARVREMVELPLKHARLFERLGVLAPQGVLLYGPPRTRQTLLACAGAPGKRVHLLPLHAPEILRKL